MFTGELEASNILLLHINFLFWKTITNRFRKTVYGQNGCVLKDGFAQQIYISYLWNLL